jgi:hypothetical protein
VGARRCRPPDERSVTASIARMRRLRRVGSGEAFERADLGSLTVTRVRVRALGAPRDRRPSCGLWHARHRTRSPFATRHPDQGCPGRGCGDPREFGERHEDGGRAATAHASGGSGSAGHPRRPASTGVPSPSCRRPLRHAPPTCRRARRGRRRAACRAPHARAPGRPTALVTRELLVRPRSFRPSLTEDARATTT